MHYRTALPTAALLVISALQIRCAAGGGEGATFRLGSEAAASDVGKALEAESNCSQTACGNAIQHARCYQPALPYGLRTCAEKHQAINASVPASGCVAIMDVGPFCHVGYVYETNGSGPDATIGIDEANYEEGVCGQRTDTAAHLHIAGYYCP